MNTAGKVIKCRAAVAWEIKKPLKIEEVEVAPPKAHEVRIKILYTALCHTDTMPLEQDPDGTVLPCILGHEGAGIVESVGEGVVDLKPGDHVIPVNLTHCGTCDLCQNPNTNLCRQAKSPLDKGVMPDGTTRFSCNGIPVYHFMGCSTFSEYTVVLVVGVAKIPEQAPLDKVCLLGCGISTGYGLALKSTHVTKGSTVGIWGLGGVGLAAAMGAKEAGAKTIVGIDIDSKKFEAASKFGVTECVNPSEMMLNRPFPSYVFDKYNGGFDFTFECAGNKEAMEEAYESLHDGWGVCCVVGGTVDRVSTSAFSLLFGHTWKGAVFGGWDGPKDIPMLVNRYLEGKIMLDEFITHQLDFQDINKAFDNMHSGEGIRCIMKMHQK